jgi:hypothetical protein
LLYQTKKGSKKYTTYLGLADSGSSGSLINREIVEYTDFEMKFQKKSTKWDTTIGILPKDKYDFILGHDLLKDLGLDIQCSASQYILNGIIIPSGHWTKNKISSVAKTWITNKSTQKKQSEANEDLNLAQILPTDYKPVDIAEVMNKQTCLTWKESENLLHALIDFQELFQMNNLFCIPTAYQKITTDEIA